MKVEEVTLVPKLLCTLVSKGFPTKDPYPSQGGATSGRSRSTWRGSWTCFGGSTRNLLTKQETFSLFRKKFPLWGFLTRFPRCRWWSEVSASVQFASSLYQLLVEAAMIWWGWCANVSPSSLVLLNVSSSTSIHRARAELDPSSQLSVEKPLLFSLFTGGLATAKTEGALIKESRLATVCGPKLLFEQSQDQCSGVRDL